MSVGGVCCCCCCCCCLGVSLVFIININNIVMHERTIQFYYTSRSQSIPAMWPRPPPETPFHPSPVSPTFSYVLIYNLMVLCSLYGQSFVINKKHLLKELFSNLIHGFLLVQIKVGVCKSLAPFVIQYICYCYIAVITCVAYVESVPNRKHTKFVMFLFV